MRRRCRQTRFGFFASIIVHHRHHLRREEALLCPLFLSFFVLATLLRRRRRPGARVEQALFRIGRSEKEKAREDENDQKTKMSTKTMRTRWGVLFGLKRAAFFYLDAAYHGLQQRRRRDHRSRGQLNREAKRKREKTENFFSLRLRLCLCRRSSLLRRV